MKILSISEGPAIASIRYLNASGKGRRESNVLEIVRAQASGLPDGLDALLLTSDLQGVVPTDEGVVLLGEHLAHCFEDWAYECRVPSLEKTGVVLAGDLYSSPDARQRGASGEVVSVWEAFANHFRFVVGVAGNHDFFDERKRFERVTGLEHVAFLDGDSAEFDGIRFGGVSYIVGNTKKRGRRDERVFFDLLEQVCVQSPDVLVLHEGPTGGEKDRGNVGVRETIDACEISFTVCGHRHWNSPLFECEGGQVVNVDARAILLMR